MPQRVEAASDGQELVTRTSHNPTLSIHLLIHPLSVYPPPTNLLTTFPFALQEQNSRIITLFEEQPVL